MEKEEEEEEEEEEAEAEEAGDNSSARRKDSSGLIVHKLYGADVASEIVGELPKEEAVVCSGHGVLELKEAEEGGAAVADDHQAGSAEVRVTLRVCVASSVYTVHTVAGSPVLGHRLASPRNDEVAEGGLNSWVQHRPMVPWRGVEREGRWGLGLG